MNEEPSATRSAYYFSDDNLYKRLSVLGNLQFYCRLRRLPKTRAVEVLEQVGLADHASVNAEKLSPVCPGGWRLDGQS